MISFKPTLWHLAGCLLLIALQGIRGDVIVLYDPGLSPPGVTETPDTQGFARLSSDIFNQAGFYCGIEGLTEFDSGPDEGLFAAFFTHGPFTGAQQHPLAPVLDPAEGFLLRFDLGIDDEEHSLAMDFNKDGISDRAGFSVLMLGSDTRGILLGFWENRIWVYEDDNPVAADLMTQAEFVEQDPASVAEVRSFELLIVQGWYRLSIGGGTLLEGRVRDYGSWPGRKVSGVGVLNPFDKPNNILVGDPADAAWAAARIGAITIETSPAPENPVMEDVTLVSDRGSEAIAMEWSSVPGEFYSIKQSSDLITWIEVDDIRADDFKESHLEPVGSREGHAYYRVELVMENE